LKRCHTSEIDRNFEPLASACQVLLELPTLPVQSAGVRFRQESSTQKVVSELSLVGPEADAAKSSIRRRQVNRPERRLYMTDEGMTLSEFLLKLSVGKREALCGLSSVHPESGVQPFVSLAVQTTVLALEAVKLRSLPVLGARIAG
jgi:hypothetical protein